jgi:hypothetical protein
MGRYRERTSAATEDIGDSWRGETWFMRRNRKNTPDSDSKKDTSSKRSTKQKTQGRI